MTDAKPRVLVVDDEPAIRELLELTLTRMGLETQSAASLAQARHWLSSGSPFALCLTDMRLPDGSGLQIVEYGQQHAPDMPVAVITAYGSIETAVEAMKKGAFDFITKPIAIQPLRELVQAALKTARAGTCADAAAAPLQLIGSSPAIEAIRQQIPKLGRSQAPVLITGETGTGKELVARLIHQHSPRCRAPFVAVNCGAIPSELMESEFFGHKRGAFTGAHADKIGLFQAACGGTLFLDEVAELPLPMQVKLLRALQERAVRPVGATTEQAVDVRILAATHRDLETWVSEGRFRHDLYYRLNVIPLHLPPLRERRRDIAGLIRYWYARHCPGQPLPYAESADPLLHHPLPGNVRQLFNLLERRQAVGDPGEPNQPVQPPVPPLASPAPGSQQDAAASPLQPPQDGVQPLQDTVRQQVRAALEQCRWNRAAAARLLGISVRQLSYRIRKLGIVP